MAYHGIAWHCCNFGVNFSHRSHSVCVVYVLYTHIVLNLVCILSVSAKNILKGHLYIGAVHLCSQIGRLIGRFYIFLHSLTHSHSPCHSTEKNIHEINLI